MFGKSLINKALAALAVAALSLSAMEAQAITRTVGPVGRDFTTINAAIGASAAGDVIEVYTGTYAEYVFFDRTVTVTEAAGETAVLTNTGHVDVTAPGCTWNAIDIVYNASSPPLGFWASGPGDLTITNCSITDVVGAPAGVRPFQSTSSAPAGIHANNVTLTIDNTTHAQAFWLSGDSRNDFTNCNISVNGGDQMIYQDTTAVSTFTGCTFGGLVAGQYAQNNSGTGALNFVNSTVNATANFFVYYPATGGGTVNGWNQTGGGFTYIFQVNGGSTAGLQGTIHKGGTLATPFIFATGVGATVAMNNVTFTQSSGAFSYIQCSPGLVTNTGTFTANGADFPGFYVFMTSGNTTLNNITLAGTSQPYINCGGDSTVNVTGTFTQTGTGNPYTAVASAAPQKITYNNVTFSGTDIPYSQVTGGAICEATGTITANAGASFMGGILMYTPGDGVLNLNNLTLSGAFSQFAQSDSAAATINFTGTSSFSNSGWALYDDGGTINVGGNITLSGGAIQALIDTHGGNAGSLNVTNATINSTADSAQGTLHCANPNIPVMITGSTLTKNTTPLTESELLWIQGPSVNIGTSTLAIAGPGDRFIAQWHANSTSTFTANRSRFDMTGAGATLQVRGLYAANGNVPTMNITNCIFTDDVMGGPAANDGGAISVSGDGTVDLSYNTFVASNADAVNQAIRPNTGGGTLNLAAHNNLFALPGSTRGVVQAGAGTLNVTATKNLVYTAGGVVAGEQLTGTIVNADPLLNGTQHLSNTSFAAIGKADGSVTVGIDFEGDPRPGAAHFDNTYDLGADQNAIVPVEASEFSID